MAFTDGFRGGAAHAGAGGYDVENIGQILNLGRYAHFTSPIRRYADLTVHRALISALKAGKDGQTEEEAEALPDIAEAISATERRAMIAERSAGERYLAAHMVTKSAKVLRRAFPACRAPDYSSPSTIAVPTG